MKLSQNFWLYEFTKSQTASRLGINNYPSADQIYCLKELCKHVAEPVRRLAKRGYSPSSGVRVPKLDAAIRGLTLAGWMFRIKMGYLRLSQHTKGQAMDFEVSGIDNRKLAQMIMDSNIQFDQMIMEYYTPGDPNSGWIHISYDPDKKTQRRQVLWTKNGREYRRGLPRG